MTRIRLILVLALAVMVCPVAVASAGVVPANEPAFTKTAGNNSYWFNWTAQTGLDSNGFSNYTYYLCFSTYHNDVPEEESHGINGPGSPNCTGSLRNGVAPSSGTYGVVPYGTSTVLTNGHRYSVCGTGFYLYVLLWKYEPSVLGCPSTTIDRDAPTVGVQLAGGAELTTNALIPAAITYNDPTSPPWPGVSAASNWTCIQLASACTPGGQPDATCSHPRFLNSKSNSFSCSLNIVTGDGRYFFCTRAADSAVPDNPNGPDQLANATSNNANLSAVACDSVVLDRTPPTVQLAASATTVTVGQSVSLTSSASDANGVDTIVSWAFGDGIGQSGGSVNDHTYAQPGTYTVKVTWTDMAGNKGSASRTITVNAASQPPAPTPVPPAPTPEPPVPTPVPPVPTPVPPVPTPVPPVPTPTPNQLEKQVSNGEVTKASTPAFSFVAPKRHAAGTRMTLAVTPTTGGTLTLRLVKDGKTVSSASAKFRAPGTYLVYLSTARTLKGGRYTVTASFTPNGAKRATTATATVAIKGKKAKPKPKKKGHSAALQGTAIRR